MLITPIQKVVEGGRQAGGVWSNSRNNDSADEKGAWASDKRMTNPVALVYCHSAGTLEKLNVAVGNLKSDSSKNLIASGVLFVDVLCLDNT
jgi:hypothetical protein